MGQDWKWNASLLPTFHWPKLRHMTPPDCRARLGNQLWAEREREVGLESSQPVSATGRRRSEDLG